ncbi:hypothetical protein ABMA27_003347 [Loxostege sticticalis]|uniref:Tc1-like transposase DDE domain-containing protein n=1 Tax=Loxostege sticticalis TaxID=481309 RepID=A0ABR3HSW5_LOXSC
MVHILHKDTHTIEEKGATKKKLNIVQKLDSFQKTAIRQKVHSFFMEGELPTLDKIEQEKYSHRTPRNSNLADKIYKRNSFFRNEQCNIYYLDETWVNAGQTVTKVWTTFNKSRQAFVEGVSTGSKNPTDDCQWVFECSKTGDYHETMDAIHFEEWFRKVISKMQPNDVVVMENASYIATREKTLTTQWKKQQITDWLISKNVECEAVDKKPHLMKRVDAVKINYQKYVTGEIATEKGVTVLRLPPYHCELNPIELKNGRIVWNTLKKLKQTDSVARGIDDQIDNTVDRIVINLLENSESDTSSIISSEMLS